MDSKQLLFSLIRNVVCDGKFSEEMKAACREETLEKVYQLANHHDLAHLVGQAISKLELPNQETAKKCRNAAMIAFYRYAQIQYEYQQICDCLEKSGIPFIPLKGSVLRAYYPEPWMRNSCDIDILVTEDILENAAELLATQLGYAKKGKGNHDISLYAPNGVHLELHYLALDEGCFPKAQKVLEKIWEHAVPAKDKRYHLVMSDEMFYFYHIVHMAKHFNIGGCGIRPFLDIWILNHRMDHNPKMRERLLEQGGMISFSQAAEKLSEIWFSQQEMDTFSQKLESFILDGGVYGTVKGMVAVSQTRKRSKVKYALERIFLPYVHLKYQYPILQKHKWLTPIFEVVRWFKLLFTGRFRSSMREMQINATISPEEISTTDDLIQYLGL